MKFYETGHIRHVGETLLLWIKHIDAAFHGWENKDGPLDFRLVKPDRGHAYVDERSLEKISPGKMNIYVVIEEEGHSADMIFRYKKE